MVWLVNAFVKLTGGLLWVILAKPKIHYEDRSVQGRKIRGKAIVISNHTEVWDYAAMMFLFPGRILRCVVAELMYEKNPFLTFLIKALGSIRVDRNTADFAFLGKCCNVLKKGGVVEFYPEARIQKGDLQELCPLSPVLPIWRWNLLPPSSRCIPMAIISARAETISSSESRWMSGSFTMKTAAKKRISLPSQNI